MVALEAGGGTGQPRVQYTRGQAAGCHAGDGRRRVGWKILAEPNSQVAARVRTTADATRAFRDSRPALVSGFLAARSSRALQMILERTNAYRPIAGRLRQALSRSGTREGLDLFSGAGGPWPSLVRLFESEGALP